MRIVADASALGRVLLPDEDVEEGDYARHVCATHPMHVPLHWTAEMANLVCKAHRRRRIDLDQVQAIACEAALLARSVTIEVETPPDDLIAIALQTGLSVYDASYLSLARRLGIPLLAFDGPLRRAAMAAGLEILPP